MRGFASEHGPGMNDSQRASHHEIHFQGGRSDLLELTYKAAGIFSLIAWALSLPIANAQSPGPAPLTPFPLMPLPAHVEVGQGQLSIDESFSVACTGYTEPRLTAAKDRFLSILFRETGIPLNSRLHSTQATLTIHTDGASKPVQQLGEDESYQLEITPAHAQLTAANPLGILHGLQTFLQLVRITPSGFAVPAATIEDGPRFPWRGLMIDAGRHFMPVDVIERNLDGMEAVKLNVLHWHLSEDQGFRVESKVFPLLQQKGSNGLYYSQAEVKSVLQYARERGIRVVPEFDVPCHTTAWFAAYPSLASGKGPYKIETRWGVMDPAMDPTREATYRFLDRLFGEMAALFPDAYFHIGGDECDGKEWNANPRIQAYMRAHGIKNNAALQSRFTARVQKLVARHHKIMEGWDEVLQPDTPRDVVIQSWRGPTALAAAARQGNRGLLSNGYYIDLNQPAAQHYLIDPLAGDAASLMPEEKARILGGEATMWSEYVTSENVDSRIWPRTAAIAERLWSAQNVRDVTSMYARLAVVSQRLQNYGLHHLSSTETMLERMTGDPNPEALRVLASVVQPPEGYERGRFRDYTTATPLNRLVDAVPPESDVARRFSGIVGAITAGTASPEQGQEARERLVLWRDNDRKLHPLLAKSDLTAELAPVSKVLSQVAAIGLAALDDLENHRTRDAARVQDDLKTLKAAEEPKAALLDRIVPPVEQLVRATASR
jgi:hexosaminidase